MKSIYQHISEKLDPFLSEFKKNIKLKKNIVLVKTPEYMIPNVVEILSEYTKRNIEVLVYDEINKYSKFNDKYLNIKIGDEIKLNLFEELGYVRVNRVWNHGEYSVVGDVLTYFKRGDEYVTRISLFDSKVERITLLENNTRTIFKEISETFLSNEQEALTRYSSKRNNYSPYSIYYSRGEIDNDLDLVKLDIGLRGIPGLTGIQVQKILNSYEKNGYEIFVSTNQEEQEELNLNVKYKKIREELDRGFVISNQKIVVITDFELSGKIDLNTFGKTKEKQKDIFKEITKGDFVVHEDHGIGVYQELIEQDGKLYIEVSYAGKDKLLIPLSVGNKISKYVGSGKSKPILTGLNSGVWLRIKGKAKEDIMAMASELVNLYAMRDLIKTNSIIKSSDDIFQLNEFIEKFKYKDTEDQIVITNEIVEDLKKNKPMDRLIVGDVGFGKTELAARAMFSVANSGRQSCILAPTTVLSMQHFKVLKERYSDYPFRVELLNRYIKGSEKDRIIEDIKKGLVDIVVGTHSVLSDKVVFKDLGLLVIDEEQKFGVAQKETLKKKRLDVHTLSMTATPIPRTLNMALGGIRDLSILSSVPTGRKSIENYFGEFDWDRVLSAIQTEIDRGGQVYYLHNRIKDLNTIKVELESRNNNIKVVVAHGGLSESKISSVMNDFINNQANVLVCSSIIENGLDIPNVNTVIVDDAQRYGLSSLYQIRGRVGRSERQAYAYFFHNTYLKGNAHLRLDALAEANNIGSGFILSNRDLEIRGSGNILGKSQSGVINSVGYALYTQMLMDAVSKLKKQKM